MAGGADDQQLAGGGARPGDGGGDCVVGKFDDRVGPRKAGGEVIAGIDFGGHLDAGVQFRAGDDRLPHAALRTVDQEAQRRRFV